ncbi:MAG: membrane dipeptidase [Thermotogota bacterium]|nr:membrane dipeptidase [Thermotogota bacterium]
MRNFNVDIHYDLMMFVEEQRRKGRENVIKEDHIPGFREGNFRLIVSSLYIDDIFLPEMALRKCLDQISGLYQEIKESGNELKLCRTYADIEALKETDQIGIILAFEGVEPLYNDLDLLDIFYELGVRIMGINWSRRNYAADGSFFAAKREGKKGGLTPFGVELVEKAQKLGMILDVSHLNDEGFDDVVHFTEGPFIATHSNSRSLVPSMRNLTDDQIRTIGSRGGLIGINSANNFVSNEDETSNIAAYVDQILKIGDLIGIEHVALGFDFCDFNMSDDFKKQMTVKGRAFFNVVRGYSDVKNVEKELIRRGVSQEEIRKVFSGNFLNLMKEYR